uniref:GLOBIN domain-containing protein n=1 Tax=Trichuris muris TaxID=70415 RepID=A0A5S6Q790_TRIMR
MTILKDQLNQVPPNPTNGALFYKTFFTVVPPEYSKLFGMDKINPADVPGMVRFQKLGEDFLKQLNKFVDLADNEEALKNEVKQFMMNHKNYNVGAKELEKAEPAWMAFLESKTGVTPEQRAAWHAFFAKFMQLRCSALL